MATGLTGAAQITKAVRTYVAEMQFTQENGQMMAKLVDTEELPKGQGLIFRRPYGGAIDAFEVAMDEEFDNPQQYVDQAIQITPTEKITQMLWPKRLNLFTSENFARVNARVMSAALEYKRDVDLISLGAASTGVLGDGTGPLTVGMVSAAMAVIQAGIPANGSVAWTGARATGDPGDGPWYVVAHPFNQHDLRGQLSGLGGSTQLTAAVAANYPTVAGTTSFNEAQIRRHYRGPIAEADFMVNGNMPITANKVRAFVFDKEAFLHITYQGVQNGQHESGDTRFIKATTWIDYGFGINKSVWAQQLYIDASIPTS